ncbi:hypothetical protein DBR11_14570 [Pedobacter sp. HMWF019]|uniref:hypothetical protein n=1 Tax=Pedobacter sp. HMWF019 TaxID=2056856 RepID=UPI000D3A2251|nr:hypothetical protein [Pedobacter sp. HMWF019]PTS98548.1 hypothetical protein DBR11_14570 [Pedobacter sp. HMWF019]
MEKNFIMLIGGLLSLSAAFECKAQNINAIRKEIEKDNALYFDLFKKRSIKIVELYTDDGNLLPPNASVVRGKQALIKDFTDTYASNQVSGVKFFTQNVYGKESNYIIEEGSWQVFGTTGNVIDSGKYIKL